MILLTINIQYLDKYRSMKIYILHTFLYLKNNMFTRYSYRYIFKFYSFSRTTFFFILKQNLFIENFDIYNDNNIIKNLLVMGKKII